MRKLTLAFAVVMFTGAFETQSGAASKKAVTAEIVVSQLDSLSRAIEMRKQKALNPSKNEK